ncbi:hypothetical protein KIN20_002593 [Parelaphostrongylus tenuis]|uniref:SH2 domain-containing protein n=1 Tax=Parelaphostrongylus tenuis TaxID=148309 RepID=A0AAD5MNT5_PARTN|nr:hypothetical protein KIN20_002593 [Parelaphostrongylus tenuis]
MESECPTPYNSLYVPVKKGGVVCCLHGTSCEVAKKQREANDDEDLSEQYVNLADSERDKNASRDEVIKSLAAKLRELKNFNFEQKRRSGKHRKSGKEPRSEEESTSKRSDYGSSRRECDESAENGMEDARLKKFEDEESNGFGIAAHKTDRSRRHQRATHSSSKSRRNKSLSEFSSSGNESLLRDLDISEDRKARRRRERRERRRRENKENKNGQRKKSGMLESLQNMPCDDDKKVRSGEEKELSLPSSVSPQSSQSLNGLARSVYIGVCNFAKAEEQVKKRADFRIYHQLSHRPLLDDLEQELPLIIVYKTSNGSFRHYPIRRRKVGSSFYYYVDYGDPKVQAHASLDHLVRYYKINAQRHPHISHYADQFPWWDVRL